MKTCTAKNGGKAKSQKTGWKDGRKERETNMKNAPTRMKWHKNNNFDRDIVFCELHLIKRKE